MPRAKTTLFAAALTLLLLPAPAAGQQDVTSLDHVTRAPAGTWAVYAMTRPGMKQALTMRAALVTRTKKAIVLEVTMDTPMGKVQTRADYAPAGPDWKIKRAYVKIGSRPVAQMPTPQQGAVIKQGKAPGKLIGSEKVKTRAGTFDCKHYRRKGKTGDQDLWISDRAHPTGVVKLEAGGGAVTLVKLGKGAKPTLDVKGAVKSPGLMAPPAGAKTPKGKKATKGKKSKKSKKAKQRE